MNQGWCFGVGLGIALLCMGERDIWAQPADAMETKRQKAKGLFEKARVLKDKQKDCAAAIEVFEQSRLANPDDPETQLNTWFQMAECHEKLGQTASARATFLSAAVVALQEGWRAEEQFMRQRADALKAVLCRLNIDVGSMAAQIAGLTIYVNGKAWGAGRWNRWEPVDPGKQRVEVLAPGYEGWSGVVDVGGAGTLHRMMVPFLKALPPRKATPWTGVGVMGGGVLGIGLGLVFDWARRSSGEEEIRLRKELNDMDVDKSGCVSPATDAIEKKCDALRAEAVAGDRYLGVETAFLVGGGAALLVGGFLVGRHYLWPAGAKAEEKKTGIRLLPGPSGTWAGLGVGAAF